MCTALSLPTRQGGCLFGRNMDLAYRFGQSPLLLPRGFTYRDRVTGQSVPLQRAILGMGSMIDGYPAMAEAMNEDGLACAGLNFAGYACFPQEAAAGKTAIAPYDLILRVLSRCSTVSEAEAMLCGVELVDVPINAETPVPTLHWMIADRSGRSIVAEQTKEGLTVYQNPVSVMTNVPAFSWHLTNLGAYPELSPEQPAAAGWGEHHAAPLGLGAGSLGLPGDYSSPSRFVRMAYLRSRLPLPDDREAVGHFFRLLEGVAIPYGAALTPEGLPHYTLYASCMDLVRGHYYYRDYHSSRIIAIDLNAEELQGDTVKEYPYRMTEQPLWENR